MECIYCGTTISAERTSKHAKYCSGACSKKAETEKWRELNGRELRLSPSTVGAMHELIVCTDLLDKGYHVFRSQSPSSPCDLVVMGSNRTYLVEVTTGSKFRTDNEKFSFPKKNSRYKFDIMAVVFHGGDIVYLKDGNEIEMNGD